MADLFPDLAEGLTALLYRIVDLLHDAPDLPSRGREPMAECGRGRVIHVLLRARFALHELI
jgi:hypothetical protein